MKVRVASLVLLVMFLFLADTSKGVTLQAVGDVWLRERDPNGVFESDLMSVWNSQVTTQFETPPLSRRYGVVEFDLSSLSGVNIDTAVLRLWGGATGFSDAEKAIKQTAVAIDTSSGTQTTSMSWNAYQSEYSSSAITLEGLGTYDLESPTETEVFFDSIGTANDLALLEMIADGSAATNQRLTLVMIAAEEGDGIEYAHSWGDGDYSGMVAELVINDVIPEPVELTMEVNRTTGGILLRNPGIDPMENTTFDIDGYTLASPAGSLTPSTFSGLTGAGMSDWDIVDPTTEAVSELSLFSNAVFEEGDVMYLGKGYTPGAGEDPNILFAYTLTAGGTVVGDVEYVEYLAGDFNGDNVVNIADFSVWNDHRGATGMTASEGDADGNGIVNDVDYRIWKDNFGLSITPAISGLGSSTVPEASTFVLGAIAVVALGICGRQVRFL